jgi:hypothetical protein
MADWKNIGAIWCHRKEKDGAGNTEQYLLGNLKVGNRVIKFSCHPNPNKTDPSHPDFIIFVKSLR